MSEIKKHRASIPLRSAKNTDFFQKEFYGPGANDFNYEINYGMVFFFQFPDETVSLFQLNKRHYPTFLQVEVLYKTGNVLVFDCEVSNLPPNYFKEEEKQCHT